MKRRTRVVGLVALCLVMLAIVGIAIAEQPFRDIVRFYNKVFFNQPVTFNDTETHSGTETHTGAVSNTGAQTFGNDVTVSDEAGGGDAGAANYFKGRLALSVTALGTGTNGAAGGKTVLLLDDSPAGEFAASDADVVCTTSATYSKTGSNSLKMAVTAAADTGDGCHDGVTLDFSADEFIGFWVRSTKATVAGDLVLDLTDDGGSQKINVPALVANVWTWVNLGLPAADANKDVITDISLELSAAGAASALVSAFDVYVDAMYKWDDTEQEETGNGICLDCIYGVVAIATAAATVNTPTNLTMYTDYFVKYTDTNENLVWITDQSAVSTLVFYSHTGG